MPDEAIDAGNQEERLKSVKEAAPDLCSQSADRGCLTGRELSTAASGELNELSRKSALRDCWYTLAESCPRYQRAAARGNADAQFMLGLIYFNGVAVKCADIENDVIYDRDRALYWYQKAADQGHAEAQYTLGLIFENGGCGVARDCDKAIFWYRKSAEQGNSRAGKLLSILCAEEILEAKEKEESESRKSLLEKANSGEASAQFDLAVMYQHGAGVGKSWKLAANWYQSAAEQGHSLAQYNLACMYDNGDGVEQDDVKAVFWYGKAAAQGHEIAQLRLGIMLANGSSEVQKDTDGALCWYEKAAEQGNPEAQCRLGRMYESGFEVRKDIARAFYWYEKAAEQGYLLGIQSMAGPAREGDEKALLWLQKAAEKGQAAAACELGVMHHYGYRVEKDEEIAKGWFKKAAERGHLSAKAWLQEPVGKGIYFPTGS